MQAMGLEPKTITYSYKNMATKVCLAFLILGSIAFAECRAFKPDEFAYHGINCRKHVVNLNKFGAKGDGTTSNTAAFRSAIVEVSKLASDGGAMLVVPPGEWLTGPFNLTSSFTLYLQKGATILGSEVESEYPLIEPLPSYGRGRDVGGRHANLISGYNLTDVVITGDNGTIDGQGVTWWAKYRSHELTNTRPYLIEIMNSDKVLISNVTLINSPSWHVHPVYSSSVIIRGVTILAPVGSPNTDGINPDSCTNVKIEDCYIESGDDCIAVKSGWDQYGIKYNRPTSHLIIRRLRCISPESAVIALGSEMSGGIQDVRAEDISAIDSESGIRIKSAPGRGGFVKDIFLKGMTLKTMKYVFWMSGDYGDHPDEKFDPNAIPVVQNINYANVVAQNVNMSAKLGGIKGHPYTGICMSNVTIGLSQKPKLVQWNCTEIAGVTSSVTPQPCSLLPENKSGNVYACAFPTDKLPIDQVELKTCSTVNSVQ